MFISKKKKHLDDGHGVELLVDEELGLAEELAGEHRHRRRAVADLVVLHLAQVCTLPV